MSARVYLIGIAGPSGAGKTCLATRLAAELKGTVLGLDRYYRDLSHLSPAERDQFNFDTPEALEHELLMQQVARLRGGESVDVPRYDFNTHTRIGATTRVRAGTVVLLEGLFTLYWPGLRESLGTKVYVDMRDDVCLARRTERDVSERGRTVESVHSQYAQTVAPMAQKYVRPTIVHADITVFGAGSMETEVAQVLAHCRARITSPTLKSVAGGSAGR